MKKYQIIYADPPWRFKNWSMTELAKRGEKWARKNGRSPYDVMDNEDIYKLPIKELSDKNCILFLWATYPKLQEALETIKAWGFTYKTVAFTWVKQNRVADGWHFGLGYWTRGNPEICLLATKGVTYFGYERSDGAWLLKKLDETGNYPVFSYATIDNNPTLTSYTLAFADRVTATYQNYGEAN